MTPLEQLLARVGPAINAADFDALKSISAMLETVQIPADPATLHHSAKQARENEVLLQAAVRGLRAAHRRIAELGRGHSLTTYDGTGRKREHPSLPPRTHRL